MGLASRVASNAPLALAASRRMIRERNRSWFEEVEFELVLASKDRRY